MRDNEETRMMLTCGFGACVCVTWSGNAWFRAQRAPPPYNRVEQVESPTAEELALEQRAAEQAETLRELTSTNAALSRSARAGCHGDIGLGAARVRSVSERE